MYPSHFTKYQESIYSTGGVVLGKGHMAVGSARFVVVVVVVVVLLVKTVCWPCS